MKLFQLLFWLDFEPVNEKHRRGSTEKKKEADRSEGAW